MTDSSETTPAVDVAGHCYCGAIQFRVQIPAGQAPIFAAYCHCDSCRRAHAAPLYHVVCVDAPMFQITAGDEALQPFTKPGGTITRAFCRVCGSKILNVFETWRPHGKVPLEEFLEILGLLSFELCPRHLLIVYNIL